METSRNQSITVGTDPIVLSDRKDLPSQRKAIFVVNTSSGGQVISISIGGEAVSGSGIVIQPGGFYQESMDSGFIPTQDRITVVSDLAAATVAIHERVVTNGF